MSIKKIFIISFIIGLLIPFITHAQVKITEIMYDPEGSDTKREWIEVFNSGNTDIDLNTYFLFENNIYHKLVSQTLSILKAGEYAIIVDSVAEVVNDYKDYFGQIFDSTFSLNNTGESISLANPLKENIDTLIYSSEMGANNDGNSLQINNGEIITAGPTFGAVNKTQSEDPITGDDSNSTGTSTGTSSTTNDSSTHQQQESISKYTPPTTFKISAGRNRIVSINTPIEFEAVVSNKDIKPRYFWNFGDFNIEKRKKVSHIYEHTGTYEVVLEGKTKDYAGVSRTEVKVIKPDIEIIQSTSTISIYNKSKQELNIGEFSFNFAEGFIIVPRNTIIKGGATVFLPIQENRVLQSFDYPNGEIYQQFDTI